MGLVQRAVLKASVTRDDLDDAMAEGGWRLVNVVEGGPSRPSQLIFARQAGAAHVYVVDDLRLGVTHLTATTAEGSSAEVLAELRAALACHRPYAHEALLSGMAEGASVEELRLGLALLVLQAPDAEDGDALLRAAMGHPEPAVRGAALCALTYGARPGLLPALLAMRSGDEDPALRQAAGQVFEALYGGAADGGDR